jgi:hypothetical protein
MRRKKAMDPTKQVVGLLAGFICAARKGLKPEQLKNSKALFERITHICGEYDAETVVFTLSLLTVDVFDRT